MPNDHQELAHNTEDAIQISAPGSSDHSSNTSSTANDDIATMRNNHNKTLRPTVQALEDILYTALPVLDKGFIRVIDYMGDDNAIVQSARVSYGRGTKKKLEDKGLIKYLMRHSHSTPFEMCEIKFHIKLPIFIARQWIRHRTANVNEYSARYSILDREFYLPSHQALSAQSSTNKQGREENHISHDEAEHILEMLKNDATRCHDNYKYMLNLDDSGETLNKEKTGIARELARMNLTLNHYTQWYWKIDLHNLLHFVRLRIDPHAQFEIREYAKIMLQIVEKWVPYTFEAFENYKLNGATFSESEIKLIRAMLHNENINYTDVGMSKREFGEFQSKLKLQTQS